MTRPSATRAAFFGLGNMGLPIARCIAAAGFGLSAWDRAEGARQAAAAAGVSVAGSAGEALAGCDVLLTSLPGPAQVEAFAADPDLAPLLFRSGLTWIDLTTSDATLNRRLAARMAEAGGAFAECPLSGAVDGARHGTLVGYFGGPAALHAALVGLLGSFCREVYPCGDVGTGNAAKLVTNQLWFANAAMIGEALCLGVKAGIDLPTLHAAIVDSVGTSFVATHDVESVFARHYDPSFSTELCLKDLRLVAAMAEAVGVDIPLTREVAARFREAAQRYGADAPELSVVRLIEERSGVSLRVAGDWVPHWEK